MTPEEMAALHRLCFSDAPPPWSAESFAAALERGAFALAAPGGFALGRVVLDEAELLTLAVAPDRRHQGIGRALLTRFEAEAAARGAVAAFLEVAETNAPARALYAAAGWTPAGRRPGYHGRTAALILRRDLGRLRDPGRRTSS
ncbi:MAG: GNAT family N-acetyltransferase [Alphaproteobacteria bacterium]|nr:MAG: GNAT family N-acetyltransferase [Alphaproteobacteria bacterium]